MALPNLTKGTAVPSLYLHIAHSNDKEETDIPEPFKGAQPKQSNTGGRGKGKQLQQKLKPPPAQVQEDQYTYDDTNNYYHNEVNPEAIDLTEARILVNFSEAKIHVVEVNAIKTHTKANIRVIAIMAIITKVIVVYTITHIETFNKVIIMANLEAEAVIMAEVITMDVVTVGPIIEGITTNTISIMVMMMCTRQTNMVHHVHYVVAITTPPNIVLRKNMILMMLWRK